MKNRYWYRLLLLLSCVHIYLVGAERPQKLTEEIRTELEKEFDDELLGKKLRRRGLDGNLSVGLTYRKTVSPESLARGLFGAFLPASFGENDTIVISGKDVVGRSASTDLLADYFGLPGDYESTITFKPRVQAIAIDINGYVNFNRFVKGLYIRTYTPIEWGQINLNEQECIQSVGINNHPPGYFDKTAIEIEEIAIGTPRSQLLNNAKEFFTGCGAPTLEGVHFEKLKFSKLAFTSKSAIHFARAKGEIGWFFWRREGLQLRVTGGITAPTGNKRRAEFILEPIIGNGGSWEIDFRFSSFATLFKNEEGNSRLLLSVDTQLRHQFYRRVKRSYDLVGKPLSRYMLAERLSEPSSIFGEPDTGPDILAIQQFKNVLAPVANITTFEIDVKTPLVGNIAPVLTYVQKDIYASLGYSFSIISPQKVELVCEQKDGCGRLAKEPETWALKGDAHVIGFESQTDNPISLSATQSVATIATGLNYLASIDLEDSRDNIHIDNALLAKTASTNVNTFPGGDQTRTSIQPIFISMDDVQIEPELDRFITHQLFLSITNIFSKKAKLRPYVTLGGSIAINQDLTRGTRSIVLSQYSLWVFGGFNF